MKYVLRVLVILFFIVFIPYNKVYATDLEVLNSQKEELNIQSFIKEADKYTKNVLGENDVSEIFTSALTGKVNNKSIFSKIIGIFGKEIKETITMLRAYFNNNYYT